MSKITRVDYVGQSSKKRYIEVFGQMIGKENQGRGLPIFRPMIMKVNASNGEAREMVEIVIG